MSRLTAVRRKRQRAGLLAEHLAAAFLMCKGYRRIASRYKTPLGEIDLVMKRGRTLAFIEVKARASHAGAAEAIHGGNQSRVVRAAQVFLMHHPSLADCTLRFDAVLVAWYSLPQHLPHAFDAHAI